jgi:LPXTG-motif cell wall-anchored protein
LTASDFTRARRRFLAGTVALALGFGGAVASATPVWAAPINVTTEAELVAAAAVATSADEIIIQNDITLTATVTFPTGTTIRGVDDTVTITRTGSFTMFELEPTAPGQDFSIQSLEFDGSTGVGSAIYLVDVVAGNVSDLELDGVDIHDSTAPEGAAVFIEYQAIGGLFSVLNSEFSDNSATAGSGGAIAGHLFQARVSFTDTVFDNNDAVGNGGAAVFDHDGGAATFTATRVTATGNTGESGGAFSLHGFYGGTDVIDSTFTGNIATDHGGAIWGAELGFLFEISGTRFESNTATNGSGGAIAVVDSGDVTVTGASQFVLNNADAIGGALSAEDVEDVWLTGSSVFDRNDGRDAGGAVALTEISGGLIVDTVEFTLNESSQNAAGTGRGGAIFSDGTPAQHRVTESRFVGNAAFYGGAIFLDYSDADFVIGRSTFDQNAAGGDAVVPGFGGAIYVGEILDTGVARFFNSTFSNQSLDVGFGGFGSAIAIFDVRAGGLFQLGENTFYQPTESTSVVGVASTEAGSEVDIHRSTFVGSGGVFISSNEGTAAITHSIVDATLPPTGTGLAISSGNPWNLDWSILADTPDPADIVDVAGNHFDTNPELGPLQDNGGLTFTMEPLPGSPAIDMGDPNIASYTPFDQRVTGFPRLVGPRIDIGSIEVQARILPATGATVSWWLLIVAGAVLILGTAALVLTRRRAQR